jgi:hypothetical protein
MALLDFGYGFGARVDGGEEIHHLMTMAAGDSDLPYKPAWRRDRKSSSKYS